jgi:hypothetical protein
MRDLERGDPEWRSKVDAWLKEVKESYRIGFERVYQGWLEVRGRMRKTEPNTKGTVDILCNNPFGDDWGTIKLDRAGPYHPEILFEEVK